MPIEDHTRTRSTVVTPIEIHRPDGNFSACFAMTRKTLPELVSLKHLYLSESDSLYFEKLPGPFDGKLKLSVIKADR